MKFKKKILQAGEYISPDGVVTVTPERLKHWSEQFKRMKTNGLKIPVPWGHQGIAKPRTYEEKEYWESKYNAGFLEDLQVEDENTLSAVVDVPRKEDAERVGTVVQEVSPQIETAWKDGKGQVWNDVITHLALVTHPVVPGQENFEEMPSDPVPAYAMRLSLSNYVYNLNNKPEGGSNMAEKKPDDKEKKPVEAAETETPETETETPETEIPEVEAGEGEGEGKGDADALNLGGGESGDIDNDLHEALSGIGLFVPAEALGDVNKFKIALLSSALTLKSKIDELGGEHEDEHSFHDLNLPEEGNEPENTPGGEENNEMATTPGADNNQLQEQQPQFSMSLKKLETRNSYLEKRLEESDKARMKSDIKNLLESGRITPVIAQKLEQEVGGYRLSLNDKGEAANSFIAAQIDNFKLMPEGSAWSSEDRVRLRNVAEADLPAEFSNLNDTDADAIAERQLRQSGRGITMGV